MDGRCYMTFGGSLMKCDDQYGWSGTLAWCVRWMCVINFSLLVSQNALTHCAPDYCRYPHRQPWRWPLPAISPSTKDNFLRVSSRETQFITQSFQSFHPKPCLGQVWMYQKIKSSFIRKLKDWFICTVLIYNHSVIVWCDGLILECDTQEKAHLNLPHFNTAQVTWIRLIWIYQQDTV